MMFNFFHKPKEGIKLWFSTDIHCHVIPGVDDGSPDAATSVALLRDMTDMGLRRIIASPHVTEITFENTRQTLDPAFASLRNALDTAGMTDLDISFGAENRVDDLLAKNLADGSLITHPDKHILIENSFVQEPWNLDNTIFELKVQGYKPIMAHPERFGYYMDKPQRLKKLHNLIPFQINVLSLAGYYGKAIRHNAEQLIEAGMIDFLGTDIHGTRHTECIRRYLTTRDAQRHRDALASRILNDRVFG